LRLAILVSLVFAGCVAETVGLAGGPPAPRATDASRVEVPGPDAGEPDASIAALPADAGAVDVGCGEALDRFARGEVGPFACDWSDSVACAATLSACCSVLLVCEGGAVARYVGCDDSCAQGCRTYPESRCALDPVCEWYGADGVCGPRRG
jgi:hypothetical protein